MIKINLGPKEYLKKPKNNEKEYFGDAWKVAERDDGFVFEFVGAAHGGPLISCKISKDDYRAARAGEIGFKELHKKYHGY